MPFSRSLVSPMRDDERGEHDGLRHDPGHQELAVAGAGHRDRAAEHEREQQHEHHRLDGHVQQQLGHPLDVDQVAAHHDGRGHGQRRRGEHRPAVLSTVRAGRGGRSSQHALGVGGSDASGSSDSARWPVRCRKTSSRLGRLRPRSSTAMPWSPSSRPIRVMSSSPSAGAVMRRGPGSTYTSPDARRGAAARPRRGRPASVSVSTTLARPAWSLSCGRRARPR